MKKVFRFLSIILIMFAIITFTGCNGEKAKSEKKEEAFNISEVQVPDKQVIGVFNEDTNTFYPIAYNELVPAGNYQIIVKDKAEGVFSLPQVDQEGSYFAGWYKTSNFQSGTRVAQSSLNDGTILYARYITFGDACIVTVICIAIVFLILALLWGIVSIFKIFAPKKKAQQVKESILPSTFQAPKPSFTMADITDDDMMVAALVATIDYHNETKKDVKVVSIKQIG